MAKEQEDRPAGKRRTRVSTQDSPEGLALNTLERGRAQSARPAPPRAAATASRKDPIGASARRDNERSMPEEIREHFIGVGGKYYFPDGTQAFTDHGAKLSTRSENTEVIRSLVAIAQAREWSEIKVGGSERFRKEAWFAARIAGLEVKGYTPTEFEQERLVRAIARREAGSTGPKTAAEAPEPEGRAGRSARSASDDDPITGRLVDHGRAPYRHNPKEPMSYYVRIETTQGDRELWGVDLERAFRESLSRPTLGDEVTARAVGQDPVTVTAPRRDAAGRVIGEQEIAAHRNRWIVERSEFLTERAQAARVFRDSAIKPAEGVKEHPELQGSYLLLRAAELGAERDIRNPEDQARFVARVRASIAAAIERGEPLEPVRLRERPGRNPERDRGRTPEDTPTR